MKKDEQLVTLVLGGAALAAGALYLHHLVSDSPNSPGSRVMGFFTDTAKKLGMTIGANLDVKTAQRYLNQIANAGLAEDGIVGDATKAALKAFQRGNGIPESGAIDEETGNALQYMAAATSKNGALQKMATLPQQQSLVQPHELAHNWANAVAQMPGLGAPFSNAMPMSVKAAQRALSDLTGASLPISGHLDHSTAAALSNFQGEQGLPQTGQLDSETANALVFLATQAAPTKLKLYKRTPKRKRVTYTPYPMPDQPVTYTSAPPPQVSGDYATGIQSTTMYDSRFHYGF